MDGRFTARGPDTPNGFRLRQNDGFFTTLTYYYHVIPVHAGIQAARK